MDQNAGQYIPELSFFFSFSFDIVLNLILYPDSFVIRVNLDKVFSIIRMAFYILFLFKN